MKPDNSTNIATKAMVKEFENRHADIAKALKDSDKSKLEIAANLCWINTTQTYRLLGYRSIATYAQKRHNIYRAKCNQMLTVMERFAVRDAQGNILPRIRPEYSDYCFGALCVMMHMTDDDLKLVSPSMTVKQIRRVANNLVPKYQSRRNMLKNQLSAIIDTLSDDGIASLLNTAKEMAKDPVFKA